MLVVIFTTKIQQNSPFHNTNNSNLSKCNMYRRICDVYALIFSPIFVTYSLFSVHVFYKFAQNCNMIWKSHSLMYIGGEYQK